MDFLDFAKSTARGYVSDIHTNINEICNEICDVIVTKFGYQKEQEGETGTSQCQSGEIPFVAIRSQRGAGSEKPKDDVRKINEQLCNEFAQSQEDYKRLRGVIEQLEREYEDSKEVDYFRRYGMLKGMIKRSVLHIKLQNEEVNQVTATCGKQKEEMRKREEHMIGLNTDEIRKENEELQEMTKENRRKISMIKDLIEQLDRNYEGCKRYIVVQRYRLMKTMIKTVINNKWIRDS